MGLFWRITFWSGNDAGWGTKSAAVTVAQVRVLLQVVLPRKALDAKTAIEVIEYMQDQNYEAYRSHRRKTEGRLDTS